MLSDMEKSVVTISSAELERRLSKLVNSLLTSVALRRPPPGETTGDKQELSESDKRSDIADVLRSGVVTTSFLVPLPGLVSFGGLRDSAVSSIDGAGDKLALSFSSSTDGAGDRLALSLSSDTEDDLLRIFFFFFFTLSSPAAPVLSFFFFFFFFLSSEVEAILLVLDSLPGEMP